MLHPQAGGQRIGDLRDISLLEVLDWWEILRHGADLINKNMRATDGKTF